MSFHPLKSSIVKKYFGSKIAFVCWTRGMQSWTIQMRKQRTRKQINPAIIPAHSRCHWMRSTNAIARSATRISDTSLTLLQLIVFSLHYHNQYYRWTVPRFIFSLLQRMKSIDTRICIIWKTRNRLCLSRHKTSTDYSVAKRLQWKHAIQTFEIIYCWNQQFSYRW